MLRRRPKGPTNANIARYRQTENPNQFLGDDRLQILRPDEHVRKLPAEGLSQRALTCTYIAWGKSTDAGPGTVVRCMVVQELGAEHECGEQEAARVQQRRILIAVALEFVILAGTVSGDPGFELLAKDFSNGRTGLREVVQSELYDGGRGTRTAQ